MLSEARYREVVSEPVLKVSCRNDFGHRAPRVVNIAIKNNFVTPSVQEQQEYMFNTLRTPLVLGMLEARSKEPSELRNIQLLDTLCRLDVWARTRSPEGSPKHSLEQ